MTAATGLRRPADRIRHALLFELIGLVFLIGGGWLVTGYGAEALGVIGVVSSVAATIWNYVYNAAFDRVMLRWRGTTAKTHAVRALHAVLFELGLLVMLIPMVAAVLGVGWWEALVFDLGVAAFYVVYGYGFNWVYDRVFPPPLVGSPAPGP